MKIIGLLVVKNELDLLPQTLPHIRSLVDYIYAYDDGSTDGSFEYLKDKVDYLGCDDQDRKKYARGNARNILNRVKNDFDYNKEEVWCFITEADRFFLNKTPRQLVEEAGEFNSIEGVQLDFLRHRIDPWTKENDVYPDYSDIRQLCRWCKIDERCIVGFRVNDIVSYNDAKYPWPRSIGPTQYNYRTMNFTYSLDMPYLEHQGRRSPEHFRQKYLSGSRKVSEKYSYDLSTWESTVETVSYLFAPYRVLPWFGSRTLEEIVRIESMEGMKNRVNRRYFYWGLEASYRFFPFTHRTDI